MAQKPKRHRATTSYTYSLMDELMASATDPMPEHKRTHQLSRMWQGLAAIEKDASPTPERAAPWRLLTRADTIQRGDQGLNDDCQTWHEVVPFVCGIPFNPGFFVPIRRAMTGCTTPDTCRGRDGCNGACKLPNTERSGPP